MQEFSDLLMIYVYLDVGVVAREGKMIRQHDVIVKAAARLVRKNEGKLANQTFTFQLFDFLCFYPNYICELWNVPRLKNQPNNAFQLIIISNPFDWMLY